MLVRFNVWILNTVDPKVCKRNITDIIKSKVEKLVSWLVFRDNFMEFVKNAQVELMTSNFWSRSA